MAAQRSYIEETDADGNTIDPDNFAYKVSGEGNVELSMEQQLVRSLLQIEKKVTRRKRQLLVKRRLLQQKRKRHHLIIRRRRSLRVVRLAILHQS